MATITGIRRTVFYFFETIAIVAFVVMLGSSLLQVFFRYAIDAPLMWTEELARLMCVVTTYFGSVGVLIAREHIRVDIIDGFVSGRAANVLGLVVDVLIAWFMVAIVIGCWLMTSATWTTFTASMPWFRTAYIYVAVGVAASGMVLVLLLDIYSRVRDIAHRRTGVEAWS